MEADWSVALAATDPVVVLPWTASWTSSSTASSPAAPIDAQPCKFVDIRLHLERIDEIAEARSNPALRRALLILNGPASPFWTVKCDAWTSNPEQDDEPFDPYEMDAEPGETAFGAGSYIDLLPRNAEHLASFAHQERWMRSMVERLRVTPAPGARVDLVLRHAAYETTPGFAMTWFVEGCGASTQRAEHNWAQAFEAAMAVITRADSGF